MPRRGRRRLATPTGTWDDDEVDALIAEVSRLVEHRDAREDDALNTLCALIARVLATEPTPKQRDRLRALLYGRLKNRWDVDESRRTQPSKASAIAREVVAWSRGIGVRDVRWMQDTLRNALDPADRTKSKKNDLTGQPVLHQRTGQQMLDADGQPVTRKPRPRVTPIYREPEPRNLFTGPRSTIPGR